MSLEITLPVPELKQALPGLGKVITKSRTLPVLQSLRVRRNEQGVVTLEGAGLDTHLSYRLHEAQAGGPAAVLVPLDVLAKAAKGSAETLALIPDGKDKVRLRHHIGSSPVEQRLTIPELKEWPEAPQITSPAAPLDRGFIPALKEALQCSSDDRSRPIINSVHVDVTDRKAHYLVGTNGRILYAANSFCFDLKQSVTLPNLKFFSWSGFAGDDCQMAVQDDPGNDSRWLQLQSGPWTVTTRQVAGAYPHWRQVVPGAQGTTVQLSPEAIGQMLKVIPQLPGAGRPNSPVRLSVANGRLHVDGRQEDSPEWTSIAIEGAAVSGPAVAAGVNRDYLLQALRYGLGQVTLQDELSPLLFSQGGRKLVIMPLRLEAGPPSSAPAPEPPNPQPPKAMTKETKDIKPESPVTTALSRIETLRDTLKNAVRDLGELLDLLKASDREQRAVQKEFDSLRARLRSLQNLNL